MILLCVCFADFSVNVYLKRFTLTSSNIQLHEGHSPEIRLPLIVNVNLCSVLEYYNLINCSLQFNKEKPPLPDSFDDQS